MDEQHQNFEYSEGFGFINAFSGTDNFLNQQQEEHINSKALTHEPTLPTLTPLNSDFDSRSMDNTYANPPPMYDIPPDLNSAPHYSPPPLQYGSLGGNINGLNEKTDGSFNIQSDPIIDAEANQNVESCEKTTDTGASTSTQNDPSSQQDSDKQEVQTTSPPEASQDIINFSHSQNTMMKALGVVRKEAPGSKKRRRIVMLNDDDSDDESSEIKRDVSNKSDESIEESENEVELVSAAEKTTKEDSENEESNPDALKVKTLLKSAVIIHDPDNKKKKKQRQRVLDSDEEDHMHTSVDDIGMINEEEINEDESLVEDILISEPSIPIIENPEIPETEAEAPETNKEPASQEEPSPEASTKETEGDTATKTNEGESEEKTPQDNDGGDEIDPSMSVEAILENIKPMADDDEFFKFEKSSDENDKSVPNDEYFGCPDKQAAGIAKGKKRGPKPGSKRKPRDTPPIKRKRGDRYEKDFVDDSDSGSSSESNYSDSSSTSESSVEEVRPRGRPPGRPPMKKSPIFGPTIHRPMSSNSFTLTPVPMRKKVVKKDRFYDRSRDIPNDVYFGDVKVPLHVLHTRWNSDGDSSDDNKPKSDRFSYTKNVQRVMNVPNHIVQKIRTPQFGYMEQPDDPRLSNLKDFVRMCGIKINYAKLFSNVRTSDQKCMLIRRILAQKGLQGEPTVAKCKKLRRELQAKRESAELDKSVIIAEGRTRRSTRNVKSHNYNEREEMDHTRSSTSFKPVQPETLQTLSKIRQVIDSDSE